MAKHVQCGGIEIGLDLLQGCADVQGELMIAQIFVHIVHFYADRGRACSQLMSCVCFGIA